MQEEERVELSRFPFSLIINYTILNATLEGMREWARDKKKTMKTWQSSREIFDFVVSSNTHTPP